MESNSVHLLLVEDDQEDVMLLKKALLKIKLFIRMDVVNNGQQCMDYLRKVGEYANVNRPDLILLDLNMPLKDGRETLKEIKSDQNLKKIPVVILTTSHDMMDIDKTYELGANCYITKPVDFEQLNKIVHEIANFWFTIVKLPD